MKILLLSLFTFLALNIGFAQSTDVTGPANSGAFGRSITVLSNGNYVLADSLFGATDVGAVYLYNGLTHALISTLMGSTANDYVGGNGVFALPNGNFVVCSGGWSNAGIAKAGAVTFVNGTTGLNGAVSAINSLVGSTLNDQIGRSGIILIKGTNNYLTSNAYWNNGAIVDAGAVTWGSGVTGASGLVSSSNSLVGSNTSDLVGNTIPAILANGNYVIGSPNWRDTNNAVGAATWCNGATGRTGAVSNVNSLVGSSTDDNVGFAIFPLTNGNYVVSSPNWNGVVTDGGAATWGNGATGIVGVVSSTNSLVGNRDVDKVSEGGVIALTNGNYVVRSQNWDLSSIITNVGAVTWGNGTTGTSGSVSVGNSLIGSTSTDQVGSGEVVALTNGNYVARTNVWDNGATTNVGAVTWGNGAIGTVGAVSTINSLYGGTAGDAIGIGGIEILTNGNYVVESFNWDNGAIVNAGAVTWGSGTTGVSGLVTAANSLVGSTANDNVGGAQALKNGNYLVRSSSWDNGAVMNAGAVTWCNGATGRSGTITNANSLVGTTAADAVGTQNSASLENGNFVVASFNWDNGAITNVGAATFGNGAAAITGTISSANSLIGSTASDGVGSPIIIALANGNYLVRATSWDNGATANVGSVTLGNGVTGISGTVTTSNSFFGSTLSDGIGSAGIFPLTNGDYLIHSSLYDNGATTNAGAITYGFGNSPGIGAISSCNSVFGNVTSSGGAMRFEYNYTHKYLLVGKPAENKYTIFRPDGQPLAVHNDIGTANIFGAGNTNLQVSTGCKIIAKISPLTPNPIGGTVNSKVWVETTQPATYVKRHYQIFPITAASTAKAKVTLYFTQQEFLDYNAVAVNDLPINANDAQGKANLRINKLAGESSTGTGLPNTYPGSATVIDPDNSDIVYNSALARWEVSFITTGFSGFFAFGEATVALPVTLLDFYGKKVEEGVQLNWQTSNETNFSHFEIERSENGKLFEKIGKLISNKGENYKFVDASLNNELNYYRLKMVDLDGTSSYSTIISIKNESNSEVFSYPNPAISKIFINKLDNLDTITIYNVQGFNLKSEKYNPSIGIDISNLPSGNYYIRTKFKTLKIIKN